MNDISLWSRMLEGLNNATREVLRQLQDSRLCIAPDKCEWVQYQIEFLGYMVSVQGVEIRNEKVDTLKKIVPVNTLKNVQHFLGFANFYRHFIKDYSKIILLMTNSTSLEKHGWQSTSEIEQAQKQLIQVFTSAPVLRHFDPEQPSIVQTDASDFALGGNLSQRHEGPLHPIAFHS